LRTRIVAGCPANTIAGTSSSGVVLRTLTANGPAPEHLRMWTGGSAN